MSETLENLLNRLITATIVEAQAAYPTLEPEVVEQVVVEVMNRDLQGLKKGDSPDQVATASMTEITRVLESKLN